MNSLDKKTRWSSPGQLMLRDRYEPQTALEKRDPLMRYAVTETLPIDIFIETCNLNYNKLRKRSEKIREILNQCEYIRIVGKVIDKYKTDFTVNLISKDKKRRLFTAQDSDVRTIIDKEDVEKVKNIKWCLDGHGYAFNFHKRRLHNFLLKAKGVDHINRNKLDNRKENLRIVSQLINSRNCSLSKNNTSGLNGVSLMDSGKWRAYINLNYKQKHLGCFNTKEEACAKRLSAEKELWGETYER